MKICNLHPAENPQLTGLHNTLIRHLVHMSEMYVVAASHHQLPSRDWSIWNLTICNFHQETLGYLACMRQNTQLGVTLWENIEIPLWQYHTLIYIICTPALQVAIPPPPPPPPNILTISVIRQQICKIKCRFNICKSILSKILKSTAKFRNSSELLLWKM